MRLVRLFHSTSFRLKIKPFLLADIGEGITECEIIQWFVKPGDRVAQFDKICEVQSDKAAVEITSRFDGIIKTLHYDQGAMAKVGKPLVDIDTQEGDSAASSPAAAADNTNTSANSSKDKPEKVPLNSDSTTSSQGTITVTQRDISQLIMTTPSVRRIARENTIDLSIVPATGKNGRIMKEDILAFLEQKPLISSKTESVVTTTSSTSSTTTSGVKSLDEKVPLTPIQKAMFKSMTKSLQIPHFGFSEEINMNQCQTMRDALNGLLKKQKLEGLEKITFMPIMMKAMSLALSEYTILNACIVEEGQQILLQHRSSHNIGIAMDTRNGLVVPNVKDCQNKSIVEIALELERLKAAGQKGALSPSDLSGGTITLSNIGNIGGTVLHPVLVSTEVCIGAVGRIQKLPRFTTKVDESGIKKEVIEPQNIMQVSWNADHRVIDGATMARFVTLWKQYLEQPNIMLVHLK